MSEEYEKNDKNKQEKNGESVTGLIREITENNWIFWNFEKRVQKIPWLISVIEILGGMTRIIRKMTEKSTWELTLKASYYNY